MVTTVKKGKKVKVEYTGRLKVGGVFDRSGKEHPLEFTVGDGKVIPGFEEELEGMQPGEQKSFIVDADEAYGEKEEEAILRRLPRTALDRGVRPEKGSIVQLHLVSGETVPATIADVTDSEIVVDINHPLAGKDLVFDVRVVSVE